MSRRNRTHSARFWRPACNHYTCDIWGDRRGTIPRYVIHNHACFQLHHEHHNGAPAESRTQLPGGNRFTVGPGNRPCRPAHCAPRRERSSSTIRMSKYCFSGADGNRTRHGLLARQSCHLESRPQTNWRRAEDSNPYLTAPSRCSKPVADQPRRPPISIDRSPLSLLRPAAPVCPGAAPSSWFRP